MIKNIKKIGFVLIATFFLSTLQASTDDKTITMIYQLKAKAPYIGGRDKKHKKFDNEGLYKELYTTALKKIGYNLEIKRFPKKVAHKMLKKGKLDFYPMASFSQKKAKYTYYIPNSLKAKNVVVSKANLKKIVGIKNMKGRLLIDKKYPNTKVVKINKKDIKFLTQNCDKLQPISIKNFPTIISQNRAAYKLMSVLKQMKEDETTQKLVNNMLD
jgi:hypothetical protein